MQGRVIDGKMAKWRDSEICPVGRGSRDEVHFARNKSIPSRAGYSVLSGIANSA